MLSDRSKERNWDLRQRSKRWSGRGDDQADEDTRDNLYIDYSEESDDLEKLRATLHGRDLVVVVVGGGRRSPSRAR